MVVLVGNAGRDPELRFFESGSCVSEFTLAINRPPRDGQNQEPLWVNCKAWGKTAQLAGDYVRKGSKVAIVGRLEIEQWTDRSSGEVRSKTLVVIDRLELCGSRSGGEALSAIRRMKRLLLLLLVLQACTAVVLLQVATREVLPLCLQAPTQEQPSGASSLAGSR